MEVTPTGGGDFTNLITVIVVALGLLLLVGGLILFFRKYLVDWVKFKEREKLSLQFVLLQIRVPRGNEIKIDAIEQLFSTLSSLRQSGGILSVFKVQPHLSFEIVALHESIRFFVSCNKAHQDLIEKQIHGAYPDAEIKGVPEYNIFSETGEVAYVQLKLKNADYFPVKTFRDLPTDPLSALTSAFAKMQVNEGAAIQLMISPSGSSWKDAGKKWAKKQKEPGDEKNPKAPPDAKELEAVEGKLSKPGFDVSVRLVVSSTSEAAAKAHLTNIWTAFE